MIRHRQWFVRHGCAWVSVAILLAAPFAMAQLPTATVLGVVKDSTGAVVPDANVTVRNLDTGQTRTGVTSADGSYRLPALPVGNYEVRVEHIGFQAAVQSGLTLSVSQEAVVNFALQVGAMEQTVSVTADAPLVNTTTGSLGGLVDEQRVADLPLNGRNFIDLTLLQTGVEQHKNVSFTAGMSGTWFSSNGAPLRSNNFLLDGAIMQNLYGASSASIGNSTLGVEGIREYRVVTNSFSAEYGMAMGSQMTIVSKSGTNNFHGSVFEYLRNSALDARNFFDRKTLATPRRLPAFTRNSFGAAAGGPIVKDKSFFFGVYEGLRERLGLTKIDNVPAAGCHGGANATITNIACPQLLATPSVTVVPVVAPLLALFPNPNLPNNQFTFPFSRPDTENYGQMRIDHAIAANDSMFGRYTIDDGELVKPIDYPQFRSFGVNRSQYATLSENHIFSPTLLNTFRYSYSRTKIKVDSPSGLSGPNYTFIPGQEIGSIAVGGVTTLAPEVQDPIHLKQNIFTWSDDLFYTKGRHSLKFGTLVNRFQQYMLVSTNSRGTLSFANMQNFLSGAATSLGGVTPGSVLDRTYFFSSLGFYAQDDFHITSRLTLNLGLRYEFITQPQEVRGHGAAIRDVQHDADTTLGAPYKNPSLKDFSPRFGFAWDVFGDGKTAVRGGFGLLYDLGNLGSALIVGTTATPPFSRLSTVANPTSLTLPFTFPATAAGKSLRTVDYLLPQPHLLEYNLTVERQLPWNIALTVAYGGSRGINIVRTVEGNPTVPQLLGDGRQFWPVGAPRTNPNWTNMEFKTGGGNSWYNSLQVGLIKRITKGLQFQSSYTWSRVIDETQAQLAADDGGSSVFGTDPAHRQVDRGLADFDSPHNWRFNTIYYLPGAGSGVTGKLLSGWWMSGILSLQTGYPFTVALNSNRSRSGVNGGAAGIDRPDLLPGRNNGNIVSGTTAGCQGVAAGQKLGTPDLYFDPCAFAIPAVGFLGTAGRNILRGPGFANLDYSLVKDTAIKALGESGKLEFRAEIFNILNRSNFALPSRLVYAATQNVEAPLPSAGVITSTGSNTSRQIQFALKLLF
jgi:hypothetical protein